MKQQLVRALFVSVCCASVLAGTPALLGATSAGAAPKAASAPKVPKGAYTETSDSGPDGGPNYESLNKVTNSQSGDGAGIATVSVVDASSGTVTGVSYFANGSIRWKETLVFGPSGLATHTPQPISGSGTCTGGSGVFEKVKCSYTYTGTFDEVKGTTSVKTTGRYTSKR